MDGEYKAPVPVSTAFHKRSYRELHASRPSSSVDFDDVGPSRDPRTIPGFVPAGSELKQLSQLGFRAKRRPLPIVRVDEKGNFDVGEEDVDMIDEYEDEEEEEETNEKKQRLDADGKSIAVRPPKKPRKGWATTDAIIEMEANENKSDDEWFRQHMAGESDSDDESIDKEEKKEWEKTFREQLGDYADMMRRLNNHHRRRERDIKIGRQLRTRHEVKIHPGKKSKCDGEIRYDKVCSMYRKLAEAAHLKLEATQVELIEEFIAANAPQIYGTDWLTHQVEWKRKHQRTRVHAQVMILTPRRFGKSTSVVLFCLAMLLVIPKITIVILSQNHRTSKLLLKTCSSILRCLKGGAERLGCDNASEFSVVPEYAAQMKLSRKDKENHAEKSIIKACPSTADGMFYTHTRAPAKRKERERERKKTLSGNVVHRAAHTANSRSAHAMALSFFGN